MTMGTWRGSVIVVEEASLLGNKAYGIGGVVSSELETAIARRVNFSYIFVVVWHVVVTR